MTSLRLLPLTLLLAAPLGAMGPQAPLILPPTGTTTSNSPDQAMATLMRDVKTTRRQVMTDAMKADLKPDETRTFWGIYDPFDREMTVLIERHLDLIRRYAQVFVESTPAQIDQLVEESFAVDAAKAQLRRRTYQQMGKALSPRTAARFYMVDMRTERLIEARIANDIPVLSSK
jgi:hypothetical protein